jgi:hypothetical protein
MYFDVRGDVGFILFTFVGELANLITKIITLSELFSFVGEFSRLQYE